MRSNDDEGEDNVDDLPQEGAMMIVLMRLMMKMTMMLFILMTEKDDDVDDFTGLKWGRGACNDIGDEDDDSVDEIDDVIDVIVAIDVIDDVIDDEEGRKCWWFYRLGLKWGWGAWWRWW